MSGNCPGNFRGNVHECLGNVPGHVGKCPEHTEKIPRRFRDQSGEHMRTIIGQSYVFRSNSLVRNTRKTKIRPKHPNVAANVTMLYNENTMIYKTHQKANALQQNTMLYKKSLAVFFV